MATTPAELRSLLVKLSDSAEDDLATVWAQLTPATFYDALMDVLPSLVGDYGDAAAALTAEWYDEHRQDLNISGGFTADIPVDPKLGAEALAGWAAALAQKNTDAAFVRTSGGLVKRIFTASRDTLTIATEQDPQARGWQRAGRGECTFCRVLISRGAVYTKTTVNFGAHDNCKCVAVPAFMGRAIPVKPYVPSQRNISDADNQRVKVWMANHFGHGIDPLGALDSVVDVPNPKPSGPSAADISDWLAAEAKHKADVAKWLTAENAAVRQAAEEAKQAAAAAQVAARTPKPREFTRSEGNEWATQAWNYTVKSSPFTKDELRAISGYTGFEYDDWNTVLRKQYQINEPLWRIGITNLDSAMQKSARVPEPVVVTRTLDGSTFGGIEKGDARTLEGRDFLDRGFMSTAVEASGKGIFADSPKPFVLRLTIPAGARAIYVSQPGTDKSTSRKYLSLSAQGDSENELILDRGSRFKVTKVVPNADPALPTEVYAELTEQIAEPLRED